MESISKKYPIGTGGGQGPLKTRTADELGADILKGEIAPLPYKNSRDSSIARNGKNS